jgi:hypothetical protein
VENILFHERKVILLRIYSKKVDKEIKSEIQFFKKSRLSSVWADYKTQLADK